MRPYLFLFLLIFGTGLCLSAQNFEVTGVVEDAESAEVLPFVNISISGTHQGSSTDIDGRFRLSLEENRTYTLEFSYIGYEKTSHTLSSASDTTLIVQLREKSDQLEEVTVFPGKNPAHRIIKNAVANRENNKPENLPSFSCKSYSKFVVKVNTDSVDPSIDTLFHPVIKDSVLKIDSGNYKLVKIMDRQHLFFMENVTERNFIRGKRDNEKVLATKTSGFKNPLFSLISTELQSFSFYSDYISITGEDFLNPLTPGSTNRYFFLLKDTAYNNSEDTVYIISFRPQPNYGFNPLQGLLYINTADWAVQNVLARPVESSGIQVEIEQKYKQYDGIWFPDQLNANLILSSMRVNDAIPIAHMRTYLKDVQIGAPLQKKNISRAKVSIKDEAVAGAPEILNEYRTDSISSKEAYTYEFMDSVSEAENLNEKIDLLLTLYRGKIPWGPVDFDIDRFISYNRYEGIRPGIGFHTNDKLSDWFSLGGYLAYGFKDKVLKYAADTEIILHKHSELKLFAGHQFDLFETGGTDFGLYEKQSILDNHYRRLFINQWDETYRSYAGIGYDPVLNLKLKLIARHERRHTLGAYQYRPVCEVCPHDHFKFFEIVTAARLAPDEEVVEGGGLGKLRLSKAYPVLQLQYIRGIENIWDSQFSYNKLDLRIDHQVKTLFLGYSHIRLQAGAVLEEVPYPKLYVATAHLLESDSYFRRMRMIADRNSFETMRYNEFVSDRYIQLMYRQDLRSLLYRRENFAPHIELVGRALWGGLSNRTAHENVDFRSPDKGYFEAGLELNKLYNPLFLSLGAGFFYRIGPYALPEFGQNFAIKLTSKFSL